MKKKGLFGLKRFLNNKCFTDKKVVAITFIKSRDETRVLTCVLEDGQAYIIRLISDHSILIKLISLDKLLHKTDFNYPRPIITGFFSGHDMGQSLFHYRR